MPRKTLYDNLLGHHKGRVEAKAEVADNARCGILVFVQKFFCAGECYLVDVLVDIFGGHTYATVTDSERAGFFVDRNANIKRPCFTLELAERGKSAQLLCGIDCVRHQLAQEYFVIAV